MAAYVIGWLARQMPVSPRAMLVHHDRHLEMAIAEDDPGRAATRR